MAEKRKELTVTVAPGRTVLHGKGEEAGPGTEVTLDEDEARALIARGFAVDPDAKAPPPPEGVGITQDGGASVRLA